MVGAVDSAEVTAAYEFPKFVAPDRLPADTGSDMFKVTGPDALVEGDFTDNFDESSTGVTNDSGVAVIITSFGYKKPSYMFCVSNVSHVTLDYDQSANVEECDSR